MRFIYLCFLLLTAHLATAQASATFSLPNVRADDGTTVCLPITVDNFSGGIEFSFALLADPDGSLTFNRVQNLNPEVTNFSMADFNLTDFLFEGAITVEWQNYGDDETCEDAPGVVTLADGAVLFEVCYDVSGPTASLTEVQFFDKPDSVPFDGMDDTVPIIFNKRAQCDQNNDAFPETVDGSVTVNVDPLVLEVEDRPGNFQPGDLFCTDITVVSGFTDLTGFQFGLTFDTTVLRTVTRAANNELPQNTNGGYNLFGGASFYGTWAPFGNIVESLLPGTPLVNVCFEVVGECGDRTMIEIDELPREGATPRPVEANGATAELTFIPIVSTGTIFAIDNCNPTGFDVIIGCPAANPQFEDTNFCIEVQAGDDFIDMVSMDYALSWNENLLRFTGIGARATGLGINVTSDFDYTQTDQGILFFDWDSPIFAGRSLDEGELVFEMCFDVIGFGGTSPITVSDFRNDIESRTEGVYNGVNPTNCTVEIDRPGGVAVRFPDVGFASSEDRCFDVLVDGFTLVTDFSLRVTSSPTLFDYVTFSSAIPGVTVSLVSPGLVQIDYDGPELNLPDGTALASLCYRAQTTAAPGECDSIRLASFFPSEVITTESAGLSVNIEEFPGESCVLFPNGFGLTVADVTTFLESDFCVPVLTHNFENIESASIIFRFDPTRARYEDLNLSGDNWPTLAAEDFDLSQVDIGVITLNWSAPAPGVSYELAPDTAQAFQFCFRALDVEGCFPVTAEPGADPATVANGSDGSIFIDNGEVCVEDRIVVISVTAEDATCSDTRDGAIVYEVAPRADGEPVFIRTSNPVVISSTGRADGLLAGVQEYTLFTAGGDVQTSGTITVGVDPANAAVADAGPDVFFGCTGSRNVLLNSTDNVGQTYRLLFIDAGGNTIFRSSGDVSADGRITEIVSESGEYVLEVTSTAGCIDTDTVRVSSDNLPTAEAGEDLLIDCRSETAQLNAGASSQGANVRYRWERVDPTTGDVLEEVSAPTGLQQIVEVDASGRYRLTVTFADLQCSATDSVSVFIDRTPPSSALSTQAFLGCTGDGIQLTAGTDDGSLLYSWFEVEQGLNFPFSSAATVFIDRLGDYGVEIVDTTNGCVRLDTIEILPSQDVPTITGPDFLTANCQPDTTEVRPIYSNVDERTRYLWSTLDGAFVPADVDKPTLRALGPGTYRVVVRNPTCADSLDIIVGQSLPPTMVDAGEDVAISCVEGATLTGSASSVTGGALNSQWYFNGVLISDTEGPSVTVESPGVYVYRAILVETGCFAEDSVTVTGATGTPTFDLVDTVRAESCDPDFFFEVELMNLGADNYEFNWAPSDNPALTVSETRILQQSTRGTYLVTVTDPASGCQAQGAVVLEDGDVGRPTISATQSSDALTCGGGPVVIDASASSSGPDIVFEWRAQIGDPAVDTVSGPILEIDQSGIYNLTVRDTVTNCSATQGFVVTDERELPVAEPTRTLTLDCDRRETTAAIAIPGNTENLLISWSGPGVSGMDNDTTAIVVTEGGLYTATVLDTVSTCFTVVTVPVGDLRDSLATIAFATPGRFDCNNESLTLDASGTDLRGASLEEVAWVSLDGNTVTPASGSLIVSVAGAGAYVLTIGNDPDCSASDTIRVMAAEGTPFADAGSDVEISCGDMPQLDGSGSSPEPGGSVLYSWTALSGGTIVSGDNDPMPFVSGVGTYELVVTNLENGCTDSATVTVRIIEEERAILPEDFAICGGDTLVTGNVPEGTTGEWTQFDGGSSIVLFNGNEATVTEVGDGIALIWTLSQPGCPNYSADTVRIDPAAPPEASDDLLELTGERNTATINVLANDIISGAVEVTFLTEPEFGTVTEIDSGRISFEAPLGLTQRTTVTYEVCSVDCPDLCSMATLTISANANGTQPTVYNAITPNGDGRNETLVFELLAQGGDFPDRTFTVFNRWGNVVYEDTEYENDWGGTNDGGDDLPEGTYYYILRLDIGEGTIIRGDVTILR